MKILGLVLAAGLASRMGSPKALVRFRGRTLLDHVAGNLRTADGVDAIRIVIGANAEEVEEEARSLSLVTVTNPRFAEGLMTSLQVGVREAMKQGFDAILVTLVDQPLLLTETVSQLATEFQDASDVTLMRPSFAGQVGHPCLIRAVHFDEILKAPASDRGAAFLFASHPKTARIVDVDDLGVTADFDHPSDVTRAEQSN